MVYYKQQNRKGLDKLAAKTLENSPQIAIVGDVAYDGNVVVTEAPATDEEIRKVLLEHRETLRLLQTAYDNLDVAMRIIRGNYKQDSNVRVKQDLIKVFGDSQLAAMRKEVKGSLNKISARLEGNNKV